MTIGSYPIPSWETEDKMPEEQPIIPKDFSDEQRIAYLKILAGANINQMAEAVVRNPDISNQLLETQHEHFIKLFAHHIARSEGLISKLNPSELLSSTCAVAVDMGQPMITAKISQRSKVRIISTTFTIMPVSIPTKKTIFDYFRTHTRISPSF